MNNKKGIIPHFLIIMLVVSVILGYSNLNSNIVYASGLEGEYLVCDWSEFSEGDTDFKLYVDGDEWLDVNNEQDFEIYNGKYQGNATCISWMNFSRDSSEYKFNISHARPGGDNLDTYTYLYTDNGIVGYVHTDFQAGTSVTYLKDDDGNTLDSQNTGVSGWSNSDKMVNYSFNPLNDTCSLEWWYTTDTYIYEATTSGYLSGVRMVSYASGTITIMHRIALKYDTDLDAEWEIGGDSYGDAQVDDVGAKFVEVTTDYEILEVEYNDNVFADVNQVVVALGNATDIDDFEDIRLRIDGTDQGSYTSLHYPSGRIIVRWADLDFAVTSNPLFEFMFKDVDATNPYLFFNTKYTDNDLDGDTLFSYSDELSYYDGFYNGETSVDDRDLVYEFWVSGATSGADGRICFKSSSTLFRRHNERR